MKSVLLRLAGPLQSWGTQGRFEIRDTEREPSKSGVVGLVGAALGMPRGDVETLGKLSALGFAARVDREGVVVRDFHTVGGGTFCGEAHGIWSIELERKEENPALTQRYYLSDASFLVALGGDHDALVERIGRAVQDPVWPIFLGRRSCPPSEPVFAGLLDASPPEAIRRAPMLEVDRLEAPPRLRIVVDSGPEGRPRQDDPESFDLYRRRHRVRHVQVDFIDRDSLPEAAP